jgi:murein DD-endopeptidase MepM/ murein hydrolase activator NlpD
MERKRKKRRILKKLKKPFRLIVLNENTFEEKFSYSLTPMNVIVMFGGFIVVFALLFYALIAFTPLKTVLVPDFSSYESRENARIARFKADSLTQVMRSQEKYLTDLKLILSGSGPVSNLTDTTKLSEVDLNYETSEIENKIRAELNQTSGLIPYQGKSNSTSGKLLIAPLGGEYAFIPNSNRVKWKSGVNEQAKSILDGTIIETSFSPVDGNGVLIQHAEGTITVYKNLKSVSVTVGKKVKAGESIGWPNLNNGSGELYFEIWKNGQSESISNYFGK